MTEVYTAGDGSRLATRPGVDVDTTVVHPTDRVRWGPIFAGLFAALTALLFLAVLGAAVAGTTYDAGDRLRSFGIGAGIWGAASVLIAFCVGGWMAARTAAVGGGGNGALQGAMVAMVAIPLMLYLLASGVGSAVSTAGSTVATAAQTAGSAVAGASDNPQARQDLQAATQQAADKANQAMTSVREQVTPERAQAAANTAGKTAWGTLVSLLLAIGASTLGGLMGNRKQTAPRAVTA